MILPNRNIIQEVDLTDTENFIPSPDLIPCAIDRGGYTPAVPGDYSDFNFSQVYSSQPYGGYDTRQYNGQKIMLQREPDAYLPFAVFPDRFIGMDDIKEVLDIVSSNSTRQSSIFQFRDNPDFTVWWRTLCRPRSSPYVPWYNATKFIPESYGWIEHVEGLATHFSVPQSDVTDNPDRAWWAFRHLMLEVNARYDDVIGTVREGIDELENNWAARQKGIETAAGAQYKKDPGKAIDFLTRYSHEQAQEAWDFAIEMFELLTAP